MLIVRDLGRGQRRLRVRCGDIHSPLDLHQQGLHLPGPRPLPLLVGEDQLTQVVCVAQSVRAVVLPIGAEAVVDGTPPEGWQDPDRLGDRKSTRLNSSHEWISY